MPTSLSQTCAFFLRSQPIIRSGLFPDSVNHNNNKQRFLMKRNILFGTLALLAGSLIAADSSPKDGVKAAAKALADQGSYSWKITTDMGGGGGGRGRGGFGGPVEGKVGKDGVAVVTMGQGDNAMEVVIKGDKRVLKTEEGWQTPEEMAAGGGRGGFRGGMIRNIKLPAADASDLVGKVKELKLADGVYSGDLTEDGAKSFLTFGGRRGGNGPDISGAKGSAKFWVKDGQLTKYEYNVQGTVSFNDNEREINRTTTVEIKDVGATKVDVPDEAKKKVS